MDKYTHKPIMIDIETDSLDPTIIWVACLLDLNTGKSYEFRAPSARMQEVLDSASCIVAHNGIKFDFPVLSELWGVNIPKDKQVDTLVMSHLMNVSLDDHSLEAWGTRLGVAKINYTGGFDTFTEDMLVYCRQDVQVLAKLYEFLRNKLLVKNNFRESLECELRAEQVMYEMHLNGFTFNIDDARLMHKELTEKLDDLLIQIQKDFPPSAKVIREVTPRMTKHGRVSKVGLPKSMIEGVEDLDTMFAPDAPFTLVEWVPFNPGSVRQIVERMNAAGWKPTDKTKGHLDAIKARDKEAIERFKETGWKVNETNLATLPDDAPASCSLLVEYILTAARVRSLTEWMEAYNPKTGRIHGSFVSLGTRTHRCAHSRPNLGNIATAKTIKYNTPYLRDLAIKYGARMRAMWTASKDSMLVGTDMEGAHLRIFAHLINDKEFIDALVNGDKKLGTDPHSVNKRKLGDDCVDRDRAKTFIFTYLNGGSSPKVAEILSVSKKRAQEILDAYVQSFPGLLHLKKNQIPYDASRGYFEGLDGRLVVNDSEHHMIGMYLQNAESVIMKHAMLMWMDELDARGIKYKIINWVHDEWITEVWGGLEVCQLVAQIQCDALAKTGEKFGMRCPIAGESKIGTNWLEVH